MATQWRGISGKLYPYEVRKIGQGFPNVDGNYIFAKVEDGRWKPVYIGQGNLQQQANLKNRTDKNPPCIIDNGATHIHTHRQARTTEEKRKVEEEDLARKWKPPCNDTFK